MPFTTWIRDLFGIRKDVIDTKKAKLEITRLEAEERERNLITPATLDDVKKYDPNYEKLKLQIEEATPGRSVANFTTPPIWLIILIVIIVILYRYCVR
jgi:hypothetical protein